MVLIILIIITIIVNMVLLFRFIAEKTLTSGVAFFMVLLFCVSVAVSYFSNIDGLGLELRPLLRERALKELKIELESFEQYEECFKTFESHYREDEDELSLYGGSTYHIYCFAREEDAIACYNFSRESNWKSKKINDDYEYAYSNTSQSLDTDVFWYYLPTRTYSTEFVIRYKKVVFVIWELSDKRISPIHERIKWLMERYEKYLEENERK